MTQHDIRIGRKRIGESTLVVAEAGVNHNGSLKRALKMVDEAAKAGADAIKFQLFEPEHLVSAKAPKANYQRKAPGKSQLEMLQRLSLSQNDFRDLSRRSAERGITFLCTPFDRDSADFLDSLNVPAFKIGSGDLTNFPLLEHVARKGKPIILSTGMATLDEVSESVRIVRSQGNARIVLLHCVSSYPSKPSECNLKAMQTMRDVLKLPVGFSDHTLGIEVALAAVALGAVVIEKHFTLSRRLSGPDHKASIEPTELRRLIDSVRMIEQALGDGEKRPTNDELDMQLISRRSLTASVAISKGQTITEHMLECKRPGTGIPPKDLQAVIGKRAARSIARDEVLTWDMIE